MGILHTAIILTLASLPAGSPALCAAESEPAPASAILVQSPEPGWPQWRGPRRDGICDEKGLLEKWPEIGPDVIWSITEIGFGYSAPIISHDRLFITGDREDELHVFAYDLEGNQLWQTTNGQGWKKPFPGARACPVYAQGRLFHLNAHGRLACLDAATGDELWVVEVHERFKARNIQWAKSECLLVDGNHVIVTPGGNRALMAALDVNTGTTVWTTPPINLGDTGDDRFEILPSPAGQADPSSYTSPVLFEFAGRRILASCSLRHFFGVDAGTGELLWVRPLQTRYKVLAATPVLAGDLIFTTAPDSEQRWCYRMRPTDRGVELDRAWDTDIDTCHGGLISAEGSIFATRYRPPNGWVRLDAKTGKTLYEEETPRKGSMLMADGRIYGLTEEGAMLLMTPTADQFRIDGRFTFSTRDENKRDVWAHPVIHQGRLYLRYHDRLTCYDITGE